MKKLITYAIIVLIVGGGAGNTFRFLEQQPDRMADFSVIPLELGDYRGQELLLGDDVSDVLQATATTMRDYRSADGDALDLFVGYFKSQKFGASIHSPKHCLPGSGWKIQANYPYQLKIDDNLTKDVNRMVIAYRNQKALMLYWFETRAGAVRSEYGLKFDLFTNALMMRPTDAAFIRITVPIKGDDVDDATWTGVRFIRDVYPSLIEALPF